MSKSRQLNLIGIAISVALIAVAIYLFWHNQKEFFAMKPNEWGDYVAGVSAPLAFLWLVIGYMQQGEELRLSTEALRLQAEELRNSVMQQQELVKLTREQLESDREALQLERKAQQDALSPQFLFLEGGSEFSAQKKTYIMNLQNKGSMVTEVKATVTIDGKVLPILEFPMSSNTCTLAGRLELKEPWPRQGANIEISYRDSEGNTGTAIFLAQPMYDSPDSPLKWTQIFRNALKN